MRTSATVQSWNPDTAFINFTVKFAEVSWVHRKRSRQGSTHILFPSVIPKQGGFIGHQTWSWIYTRDCLLEHARGWRLPPSGLFANFNIQVTSFLDNAASHECIKLLGYLKGRLIILGPTPESVHPYIYCQIFPWYFEREYLIMSGRENLSSSFPMNSKCK